MQNICHGVFYIISINDAKASSASKDPLMWLDARPPEPVTCGVEGCINVVVVTLVSELPDPVTDCRSTVQTFALGFGPWSPFPGPAVG